MSKIVPQFHDVARGPFAFMENVPRYANDPGAIARLDRRYEAIVAPFVDVIANASVLDLASHDGRWAYALACAGAREVLGIEGRQSLIDRFDWFPKTPEKDRVTLVQGDIFETIEALIASEATVDAVAVFGIFYHITEHYRLLKLIDRLRPRLIIIDSDFAHTAKGPILRFAKERTDNELNTIDRGGSDVELVAVPSYGLMELMADVLGYDIAHVDWFALPEDRRDRVQDYFREKDSLRCRGTIALRPKSA